MKSDDFALKSVVSLWFVAQNGVKSQAFSEKVSRKVLVLRFRSRNLPVHTICSIQCSLKNSSSIKLESSKLPFQKVMTYHSNEWVYLWCGRFLFNFWLDFCRIFSHRMYILLLLEEENRSKTQSTWYKVSFQLFYGQNLSFSNNAFRISLRFLNFFQCIGPWTWKWSTRARDGW